MKTTAEMILLVFAILMFCGGGLYMTLDIMSWNDKL
jgi:hypothetical protein